MRIDKFVFFYDVGEMKSIIKILKFRYKKTKPRWFYKKVKVLERDIKERIRLEREIKL